MDLMHPFVNQLAVAGLLHERRCNKLTSFLIRTFMQKFIAKPPGHINDSTKGQHMQRCDYASNLFYKILTLNWGRTASLEYYRLSVKVHNLENWTLSGFLIPVSSERKKI